MTDRSALWVQRHLEDRLPIARTAGSRAALQQVGAVDMRGFRPPYPQTDGDALVLRPDYENDDVQAGALLRIASDLLVPFGELGNFDRFELLEWLSGLGITPETGAHRQGPFWVQDACSNPEPRDEVSILRSEGNDWVIGYWERGRFDVRHRFSNEGDACKWMLHDLVSHHAVSMGTTKTPPHVNENYREALAAALDEVARLVRRLPTSHR